MAEDLMHKPTISVLMPVFNGEQFLRDAIDSILSQTYIDFELLIINDGSTDSTEQIIQSYNDKRIKYHINPSNLGLINTLNRGIALCSGKYIARMDADDISLPQRLEKQIDFLEQHPEVAMTGSFMARIDKAGNRRKKHNQKAPNHLLKEQLFFGNCFGHSSMMIKKEILEEFLYNLDYPYAEDYFLWTQIADKYPVANLPEVLVLYRKHSGNVSRNMAEKQAETVKKIFARLLSQLSIYPTKEELDMHYRLMWKPAGINIMNPKCRSAISRWIHRLKEQNDKLQVYDIDFFTRRLTYRWSWKKQLHIAFLRLTKGL